MDEYIPTDKGAVGVSSVLRLNDELRRHDECSKCIQDLQIIKSTMQNGTYDNNLHMVVNANEGLHDLIGVYLPPPTNFDNNNTLLEEYVIHIDKAMEGLGQKLVEICKAIFEAFMSWLSDYIDTLKRYRIKLRQYSAAVMMNKNRIGDKKTFESIEMYMYTCTDWGALMTTSEELSKLLSKMRPDNVVRWCEEHKATIDKQMSEYGTRVEGKRVVKGKIKYERSTRRLGELRWRYEAFQTYLKRAIDLLTESIEDDKSGAIVRDAYKVAVKAANDPNNKDITASESKESLALAVGIFKMHKDNVAGITRALIMLTQTAMRVAKERGISTY